MFNLKPKRKKFTRGMVALRRVDPMVENVRKALTGMDQRLIVMVRG